MEQSRRLFLKTAAIAATGLSLEPWSLLEAQTKEDIARGLVVNRSDIPRMQDAIKLPRFAPYWKSLLDADMAKDRKFLTEELRLNNHVVHLREARVILERTSFVYYLTGDKKQLDLATLALSKILEFPKWDYFQEAGKYTIGLQRAPETTLAVIFAYEWLGDALPSSTRAEMVKQVSEKGAPACFRTLWGMRHPDRVRGWGIDPTTDYKFRFDLSRWPIILNSTNLKVIPIAGLGVAGCWLYNHHPQAPDWVDMAIQSAKAYSTMFGADGCYEEGVSYWGYTTLHLSLFFDVLRRTRGTDMRSFVNFPGTVRYGLQLSMPTVGNPGDCVNFSDASVVGNTSVANWVARNDRDQIAQYVGLNVGQVQSVHGILWYDPTVPFEVPGKDLYDVRFTNDWVVSRTGWDVPSNVVALRSGLPANHEHADRNAIIFKAYGERLLHDPFHAAYSNTQPHWLLRQTEAHTAVLINGKGHQYHDGHEGTNSSWAEAKIIEYRAGDDRMVVTSDATQAYNLVQSSVELVQRSLVYVKPDWIVIYDRVRLKEPGTVQARFQIYNHDEKGNGSVEKSSFVIERPNVMLRSVVRASGDLKVEAGKLDLPKEIGVYPYIEAQSGKALEHELLTVSVASPADQQRDIPVITRNGKNWVVTGKEFKLTIAQGEPKPTITFG